MAKIGIVVDGWKAPIFVRHLSAAGRTFEKVEGPIPGTVTFTVIADSADDIEPIAKAANEEARASMRPW